MLLGNANLIMVYAALSVFFPENPTTVLASFVSLRVTLEMKHSWLWDKVCKEQKFRTTNKRKGRISFCI